MLPRFCPRVYTPNSPLDLRTTGVNMAPTIRVRTSDDQEILWSHKAVQRAGTLRDMHLHTDPDGVLIVDRPAAALCVVTSICESTHEPLHPVADVAFDKLMDAIEAAHYLAADGALSCLANELFCRMSGKSVDELIAMLCPSADEAIPDSERASQLAEPLFEPDDIAGYEDSIQAALTHAPSAVLRTLKAVSTTWRKRARFELCSRTCRVKGKPTPVQRSEITDLDAQYLIHEGRPWDAVTARLRLSGLARLRGYGFIVHLAMVRAADLTVEENGEERWRTVEENGGNRGDRGDRAIVWLGGEALRACITPARWRLPQEIIAVAVASAGSGVVASIPVQRLREEADSLATLDLSDCNVGVPGALVLASLLPMSSLTSLDLTAYLLSGPYDDDSDDEDGPHLMADDSGIFALAEALKVNGSLTCLDISCNEIGAEGGVAIAEALAVNSSLTSLDLQANNIGAKGGVAIAEALKANGSLTSLNLATNNIGQEGGAAIAEALKVNSSLTSIDVGGNEITKEAVLALVKVFKEKQMTYINLTSCNLDADGAKEVAEYVRVSCSLTTLDLQGNKLGPESGEAIAEALKVNGSLTILSLYNNQIGEAGAAAIAEALKVNSSLTSLNVSGNNITGVSAHELATVVLGKHNFEIFCHIPLKELRTGNQTTLDLSHRGIDVPGALVMAELLRTVDSLTTLNLFDNQIGAEGGVAIAEALKVNSSLTALDARYNFEKGPLGDQAVAALMEAVAGREGFVLRTDGRKDFSILHAIST